MYEELVKRLRDCTSDTVEDCAGCPYQGGYQGSYCMNGLITDAADAIESTSKAYQMMAEAYEAEVTKQNWIPVTERLPEESWERVLAYTDDGTVMTLPAIKLRNGYVRYWMPLPEPPKEET